MKYRIRKFWHYEMGDITMGMRNIITVISIKLIRVADPGNAINCTMGYWRKGFDSIQGVL